MTVKAKIKIIWHCQSRSYKGQGHVKITQYIGLAKKRWFVQISVKSIDKW